MTNSNIDLAREWARDNIGDFYKGERVYAVCEVIQSLPDQWADAEELRELVVKYEAFAEDAEPEGEKGRIRAALYRNFAGVLEALLPTPALPTLAEMTPEEREACQWMQADLKLANGGSATCVIANPRMPGVRARVWAPHGGSDDVEEGRVTPLPDLPRLEWPAQEPRNPETSPAETLNNTSSNTPRNSEEIVKVIRYEKELCLSNQDFSRSMLWRNMERAAGQGEWKDLFNSIRELKLPKLEWPGSAPDDVAYATGGALTAQDVVDECRAVRKERALPRPEDVPAGEPWLVKYDGREWVGIRSDHDFRPWSIICMDGAGDLAVNDSDITLVSRLVPENKENA